MDPDVVATMARQIADVVRDGIQVAMVVGGGNFFRGAELSQRGMDRARADYMGMLGTVMNCLALQDFLEKQGVETRVQTAITMGQVAEPYIPRAGHPAPGEGPRRHLRRRRRHARSSPPTPSPPSARWRSAPRSLLMGKKGVDGVYDSDPKSNPARSASTSCPTTSSSPGA